MAGTTLPSPHYLPCSNLDNRGWVECEIGFTALPTFTIPTCAPTSLSSAEYAPAERIAIATSSTDYPVATTTSAPEAIITPPPWLNATATAAPGNASSSSCSPLWICIDALAVCGGVSQMYGKYVHPINPPIKYLNLILTTYQLSRYLHPSPSGPTHLHASARHLSTFV
jgi:hypothetical protein